MKQNPIWFLVLLLTASVSLPVKGNAAEVSVSTAEQNTHIRTLAASCAACHGTLGNAVGGNATDRNATLAGRVSADFTAKMFGFKDGSRASTVMHHHAKGLNVDEINQLAVYFSQQKRVASQLPQPQALQAGHD